MRRGPRGIASRTTRIAPRGALDPAHGLCSAIREDEVFCVGQRTSYAVQVLGLLGVVLGALIASLAQLLMRQGERRELRRTERLSACAELVRAAELARAAQYDRWWSTHEGRAEESHRRAKEESFNQRTGLKVARSRLRLLGVTGSVLTVADRIQAIVANLHHASTREQLEAEGDRIRTMIDGFSESAATLFR